MQTYIARGDGSAMDDATVDLILDNGGGILISFFFKYGTKRVLERVKQRGEQHGRTSNGPGVGQKVSPTKP